MGELVKDTERSKVLELLKEKIEESILCKEPVVISIENSFINCLDGVYIKNYEVSDERICLEDRIELMIMLNEDMAISYEEDGIGYSFKIIHKETDIRLYFT
jgi:hypothetical protein